MDDGERRHHSCTLDSADIPATLLPFRYLVDVEGRTATRVFAPGRQLEWVGIMKDLIPLALLQIAILIKRSCHVVLIFSFLHTSVLCVGPGVRLSSWHNQFQKKIK